MFDFKEANKLLEKECVENNETTFLVTENPMTGEEAAEQLRKSINIDPLVEKAEGYQIANVEQATQALSMALQARKLSSALIASKKEITKPQVDFQRAINKLASDYIAKLEGIENNLKDKIEAWIDTNTDAAYTSGLDGIQVSDGSLKRVNTWCFEIEDTAEIPFEFLCADMEEIEKAIKGGMRTIPGVKIFLKQEIKLRVKN